MASPSPTIAKAKPRGGSGPLLKASSGNNPATIRLKVVVRHLPSLIKEDEFKSAMAEYINEETVEWASWVQGKIPEELTKAPEDSRCVIKFKNPLQITALSEGLRLHGPFTDSKGNTTNPQMEYSPFQKAPKRSVRIDARAGTIESDPDFIAFVASLKATSTPTPTADGITTHTSTNVQPGEVASAPTTIPVNDPLSVPLPVVEKFDKPKTTPLIEYLRMHKNGSSDKSSLSKASLKTERPNKESSSAKREKRRLEKSRAKGKEREPRIDEKEEWAIKKAGQAIDMEAATILKRENTIGGPLSRQSTSTTILSRQNSGISGTLSRQNSGLTGSLSRQNSGQPGTLTRQGSNPVGSSSRPEKGQSQEKEKGRERRRDRGGVSSVAAILQRDLGITTSTRRSSNAAKTPSTIETSTSATDGAPVATVTPPTPVNPEPQSPARPRRRGGRSNGRRLEREDSIASNSSATTAGPASPPVAPVAILKKLPSNASAPSAPASIPEPPAAPGLLKREGSAAGSAPPTGPAASVAGPDRDGVPTAPKGSGRHRRGPLRGGAMSAAAQAPMAMVGVPTAPAGDPQQKGRRNSGGGGRGGGGGGGGGGFRSGRGRGGGPPKRGGSADA
ncbi:Smg-4/UPF3 family-domain-containing protein [Tuber brumale]|nr:Smg-4/UPF3 family-domain-containing protein [Tuber brumale]